jgi:hypothetical protein
MATNSARELRAQYPGARVHKVANNTYVVHDPVGFTHYVLHRTAVLTRSMRGGWETWRTGGYSTPTTKDRINRFASNGRVFQKDFQWYITTVRGTFRFDGDIIQVTPSGYVYGPGALYPHQPLPEKKARVRKEDTNA